MQLLVLVSVVLGVAYATPFLPRDDPNVAAARANFIQEYNRLAALAAAAPDVNIIMDDKTHPSVVSNFHQQQQHNHQVPVVRQQQQHNFQVPRVRQQQQHNFQVHQQQKPRPVSLRQPANFAFNQNSFSTTPEDKPADIAAARANFIQEYNRLAALAAAAPDTNIIMSERTHPSVVNNLSQQQQNNHQVPVVRQQQHNHQVPVVRQQQQQNHQVQKFHQQQQTRPLSLRQSANLVFNQNSFSTTLEDKPANIAAARASFIQEYNRLAALAAASPDTNIIMSDRNHPRVVNNLPQQQRKNHKVPVVRQQQHNHQVPVVRQQQQRNHQVQAVIQQQQPTPLSLRNPSNPSFNQYSFTTNLGENQQFFPQSNFIQPVAAAPAQRWQQNNAHNTGGHLAGHIAATPTQIFNEPTRWTGPFADTLPAGVNGLPQQVADTPEVAAAKADHFRAHALARANNTVL